MSQARVAEWVGGLVWDPFSTDHMGKRKTTSSLGWGHDRDFSSVS